MCPPPEKAGRLFSGRCGTHPLAFVPNEGKPTAMFGSLAEISADLPTLLAARRKSPQTSPRCRRLVGNLRRPPSVVGSSSEISADFPTLSAARRKSPKTSPRCWQLVGNFRRPPSVVGNSSEISAKLFSSICRKKMYICASLTQSV